MGSGPPPLKNHTNIGFLSNTGPDPLNNHKATKLAFNDGPSLARQRNAIEIAFCWRADDGPLLVVFGSPHLKNKTLSKASFICTICSLVQIYSQVYYLHPGVNLHPLCSVHMSINCVHMSLICSLNISQMFQFYIKEKFDVLRMFRLLVSSRYRRVRKMQLHLVLFALFIYTLFKEDNALVICIHGPHLRG